MKKLICCICVMIVVLFAQFEGYCMDDSAAESMPVAPAEIVSFITSDGADGLKNCQKAKSTNDSLVPKIQKTLIYAVDYLRNTRLRKECRAQAERCDLDSLLSGVVFLGQSVIDGKASLKAVNSRLADLKKAQPLLEFTVKKTTAMEPVPAPHEADHAGQNE
ncbi:hypothetical protein FACS189449_04430 [Alphaproteobacteria bacterium]|nr:hypothetical protein FACS189449_04430 [Alphaproteobacteria bacterium]